MAWQDACRNFLFLHGVVLRLQPKADVLGRDGGYSARLVPNA